jgi:trans-aconitate methyltransferase
MKGKDFGVFGKYYDQVYLQIKNYEKEAATVRRLIEQHEKKQSRTLLDVGCGTGEHLRHLSRHFQCTGMDVDRNMIKTAESKVANAEFRIADMTNFRLKKKFDVITCLFSSIGYAQNLANLTKTLENFRKHLTDEGLIIVEPWIFKKDFKKGYMTIDTYEDEKVKLARMATSKLTASKWLIYMHYLIGQEGEIKHAKEIHEMLSLEYDDYIKAFNMSGLKVKEFVKENLWDGCRGLFIATT